MNGMMSTMLPLVSINMPIEESTFSCFSKYLNILRLIILVHAEVLLRQIRHKVALIVFNRREDVDQVDVDLERLLCQHVGHNDSKTQRCK